LGVSWTRHLTSYENRCDFQAPSPKPLSKKATWQRVAPHKVRPQVSEHKKMMRDGAK
jgi:hypothetical protein